MAQSLLEMAKDLVMAQIQAGSLSPEDMQKELQRTYANLLDLKIKEESGDSSVAVAPKVLLEATPEGETHHELPNWRRSIKKHTIQCLVCGATFKQLSVRHLKEHELDARLYRIKYNIPRTQPLSAKDTTATRKKIVQQSRPWEKAPTYIKAQGRKAGNGTQAKPSKGKKPAARSSA
jgi:predicted transcriptional regulator